MAVIGSLADVLSRHAHDPAVRRGLEYLAALPPGFLSGAPPGHAERVELDGDALVALHQTYRTRPPTEARWEAHRRHLDLQCLTAGAERVGVASLGAGRPAEAYDPDKDVAFFRVDRGSELLLEPGVVALFYPEDLHAPGLWAGAGATVAKVVVKVRL